MTASIVIVGAGQAGGELSTWLRRLGYAGRVTLVGDEPYPPYQRPPLSKGFLEGKLPLEALFLRAPSVYTRLDIELRLGARIARIDRAARTVTTAAGEVVAYDKLVLATGGRARRLEVPGLGGASPRNVFLLRSIADAERLRGHVREGQRLVIVGGGYVGLEVAAVAVQRGLAVTVIETTPRLLSRVTGPEIAHYLETLHRNRGVEFRFGASVTDVELCGDEARRVVLGDDRIEADLVVVGIGLVPSVELAQEAGLVVGDGIVVDEHARTSDPDILAIGDCANQPSRYLGERARLESVPNAIEHARVAALTLIGAPESSAAVPWFWSEQYGLKLQIVGLAKGCDTTVVRAGPAPAFAAFRLGAGRLRAADIIGSPGEFLVARRLVAEAAAMNPAALADPSVPLSNTVL